MQRKSIFIIALLIGLSLPLGIYYSFQENNAQLNILDPTIASAQFVEPGQNIPLLISFPYLAPKSDWIIRLNHIEFIGYELIPTITSIEGPVQLKYQILIQIPDSAKFGLYDLVIQCKRGNRIYNVTEYHAISIYNASERIRFVHFGDTHMKYDNPNSEVNIAPFGTEPNIITIPYNDELRLVLRELSILRPDFIFITGDITNTGREIEFLTFREILRESKIPVLCTSGNHDYRSPPSYQFYISPMYYSRSIGPWRIIALDSGATEDNGFFGEQFRWYEKELRSAQKLKQDVFVGLHAPSTTEPIGGYLVAGNAEFRALNTKYGVRGVFAGHHHMFAAEFMNGTSIDYPVRLIPELGPIYVKSGSATISYGPEIDAYEGWRYITCDLQSEMQIGYDLEQNGWLNPRFGFPRNGINRTDGSNWVKISNYLNYTFSNLTLIYNISSNSAESTYMISKGRILSNYRILGSIFIEIEVDLPAMSEVIIYFNEILPGSSYNPHNFNNSCKLEVYSNG
jgi:3',5'-cyclic AMP phosphodiesterase CpdA